MYKQPVVKEIINAQLPPYFRHVVLINNGSDENVKKSDAIKEFDKMFDRKSEMDINNYKNNKHPIRLEEYIVE